MKVGDYINVTIGCNIGRYSVVSRIDGDFYLAEPIHSYFHRFAIVKVLKTKLTDRLLANIIEK